MHYTQDESYYIVDCKEVADVYLGLKEDVDQEAIMSDLYAAQKGEKSFDAEKYINTFKAHKHDHFLIPAGTIHCSGSDTMTLEISATPYIFTFKLWDWDRLGLDELPRPIHLEHGEKVIDYEEKYGVSRITVRATISELERRGYVERIKGKGTIVLNHKKSEPLLKIEGFTDEMKAKGIVPTTKSAKITLVKADAICAKALQIDKGMPVYELIRVRCINDIPVVRFKTYIKSTVDMSLDQAVYYESLYDYLREKYEVEVAKITQRITAGLADEVLARELNCNKKDPMLILKRVGIPFIAFSFGAIL